MAKRYKPPVNYRAAPVGVSDEPIEIETTVDGTFAVLAEAPHYDLLTYPMTVTVGGNSRTRVAGAPGVGQYRILSTTVYGSDGQPHVEYLPVLEFNAADTGLIGAVTYYRTGTVLTSQFHKMLREFVSPIVGYGTLGALGAAYPFTADPDVRGHEGDWAILTDRTIAAVISGSWAIIAGGGGAADVFITPVAAWMRMVSVDPGVGISGALNITPTEAFMIMRSVDPTISISYGTDVFPNPAWMRMLAVDPTVILGSHSFEPPAAWMRMIAVDPTVLVPPSAPTGHSVDAGDTIVTLHPGTASGATSYNAYWTSDGTDPDTGDNQITGVTNGQQHTGRTNGVLYKYVFTAVNAGGESVVSTVASATPAGATTLVPDDPGYEGSYAIGTSPSDTEWWKETWDEPGSGGGTHTVTRETSSDIAGSKLAQLHAIAYFDGVDTYYVSEAGIHTKFTKAEIDAAQEMKFTFRIDNATEYAYLKIRAYDSGNNLITDLETLANAAGYGEGCVAIYPATGFLAALAGLNTSYDQAIPSANTNVDFPPSGTFPLKTYVESILSAGKAWSDVSYVYVGVVLIDSVGASINLKLDNWR